MRGVNSRGFCIQLFDMPSIYSAFSFFLVSQSRTGTQYKQQMGQSPVFVSRPPIVTKGEQTKQEPQILTLSLFLTNDRDTYNPGLLLFCKICTWVIDTVSEIHSPTDLKSSSMLTAAPQASWGRRGERRSERDKFWPAPGTGAGGGSQGHWQGKVERGKEQMNAFPNAEQLLPKANPLARSFEENV